MFQRRNGTRQGKRQKNGNRRITNRKSRRSIRVLRPEILEDRCMFALLGIAPLDLPIIGYDSGGSVNYDASTDAFSLSATPLSIDTNSGSGLFFSGALNINIQVDDTGALTGGVPGDDFVLTGDVDVDGDFVVDYSGTLLTGEVLGFGSQDSGGSTDQYDFRFSITGGALAGLYSGKDLGVLTTSEGSSFIGDFGVNFAGNAKGNIGGIEPLDPGIEIVKLVNGVDANTAEEAVEIAPGGAVIFTYEVTNTGNIAYAFDDVDLVDDNGTPGDPLDDVSTTSGDIILDPSSDVGNDLILSPGETWLYTFTTTAEDLTLDDCGCEVAIYENIGVVTVPGATDSDLSHYTNPSDAPPCIAYDSGGSVSYDAATDLFSLDATPLSTEDGGLFFSGTLAIDIIVDGAGALVGGVPGDDFVLFGDLDADGDFVVDYSGVLLTGEIISFLSTDSGGSTDTYEFTFAVTGGLLAAQYAGMNLHVTTTSEGSTFVGDFSTNFSGNAKGEICCECIETANLSGRKLTDQTGDGLSGDDTPLAGVTINLYQDFGTIGVLDGNDVLYASDVTDINGEYSFANVPAGMYLVEEIVPVGYAPTSPTVLAVTLAAHDNVTTGFDFANFELGSITGLKFQDNNGDGSLNGSDAGLAGWTIELDKDANGTVDATTVTGPGGTYSFTGLTAGVYRIREAGQVGWIQTTVNPNDVTVVSGTNSGDNNFGNFELGSITGLKFQDNNGDGSLNGSDAGLAGWTIELDKDANGTVDATTVTGAGGAYSFTGLTAGVYRIREVGQVGWIQTTVNPGDVTVVSGTDSDNNNFGNFQLGSITGKKFQDNNGDGTLNGSDAGLAGWTIELDQDADGDVDATTVTGVGGTYSFTGLTAGVYRIREAGQVGWIQTTVNPGDVTVVSGTNSDNNNFGNFQLGGITGLKFQDNNGDGTLNGSDAGLAGWTIELDKDANGTVDATTVTGVGGAYSFTGLTAGVYRIREAGQVGWIQTTVNPNDVTVVSGTNSGSNNFGNFQLGSITGKKFQDNNGDGILNGSDAGLAGWTIQLDKDANGTVDFTTVTGVGGTYSFTGLTAGVYRIREVGQVGWTQTTVNPNDVTVVSGTNSGNNNFGNRQLVPGIELKKLTNGVDADNEEEAPEIAPGATVTWTYQVRNTGETNYASTQVVITDDAGTPGNTSDDFSTTSGDITFQSVITGDSDNVLEPGEVWQYVATGIAEDLSSSGAAATFNFSGNSALDGTDGNIRTFSASGISVKASAFSRDKASGAWSTAWLGSYSGGLGVTDSSEGSGGNNSHTVDNIDPRDNYVLFEFSENVVVDSAFLGYVVGDSDIKVWIGTKTDPFNNHLTLSDSLLASLGFTEVNETTSTSTRTANFNNGNLAGNVLIIAANIEDTPDDKFKIEKLTVNQHACYENYAVVTTGPGGPTDSDTSYYCNPQVPPNPGIDIEKFTNGVDADSESEAPEIAVGDTVTWTYKVKNTGNVAFTASQIVVTDDNGTPGIAGDDFTPTRVVSSDVGSDGILSPNETWTYTYSAMAQELITAATPATFNFSGSTALDGTDGNIRTYTAGAVSVKTSAFSRDSGGVWSAAYLGSYSGGLGVTDSSEGNGSGDGHTVDNLGRDNYVLFEFSENVVIDSAFLGYVVGDSDLKIWIGTKTDPFNNHLTLSDSVLASLGFTEVNETTLTSARTADLNAGNVSGNVLIIAANTGEPTTEDRFKIEKLAIRQLESGIYRNIGTVTAGSVSDQDASYYTNPVCVGVDYSFSGSSAVNGTKGNVLTYTQNNVSVNASAFSRTTGGTWSTAYVGAYSDGLGVTDGSENGNSGTHRLDNVGQVNYLLFEFSTQVTVDRAFLDSVVTDSDITVWIGNSANPFHNHLTLSDSVLSGLGFTEFNDGGSSARWADFNAGGVSGNVLVIAASTSGTNDQFKLSKLEVCAKAVKFYVVDAAADDTYEYGPSGQALANYNLNSGNTNARGVASTAAGNKVWVIDSNKKVYVYDVDGKLLGSWTANGLTTPEDITTNGTDIWIVDDGANKVFKFTGAASRLSGSQSAASNFALNGSNANAKGIVTNGTNLWVVNDHATAADKVFKYNMTGSLVGSWTIDSRNSNPTGITIDPSNVNHIWIVDNGDDAVYRYQAAASRSSGSQSAAALFQLASGNIDAQGIADPPPTALEIGLPIFVDDNRRLSALAGGLTSGLKDQALATWAIPTPTATTPVSVRTVSSRSSGTKEISDSGSRLKSSLAALDMAFDVSETEIANDDDKTRGWLSDEEWNAEKEFAESGAEEALAVAFGA